jgi:hypothetical protein
MHPRLIKADTSAEPRPDLGAIDTEELLGALKALPGYTGAFTAPDDAGGDELTIVLWQTEAEARRALAQYRAAFPTAGRRLVAASVNQRQ